jgi:hypothetical protein
MLRRIVDGIPHVPRPYAFFEAIVGAEAIAAGMELFEHDHQTAGVGFALFGGGVVLHSMMHPGPQPPDIE